MPAAPLIPDPLGLILGLISIAVCVLLWIYCEEIENGNIDK